MTSGSGAAGGVRVSTKMIWTMNFVYVCMSSRHERAGPPSLPLSHYPQPTVSALRCLVAGVSSKTTSALKQDEGDKTTRSDTMTAKTALTVKVKQSRRSSNEAKDCNCPGMLFFLLSQLLQLLPIWNFFSFLRPSFQA